MQDGGCDIWLWHDGDDTTPLLKQLLIDLRDKVWALPKENSKLRDSISDTRAQIDSMQVQRAQLEEMLVQRGKKDDHVDLLKNKVKKYEKKKSYCQLCLP